MRVGVHLVLEFGELVRAVTLLWLCCCAQCREQQLQSSKPSSPLSKWHHKHGSSGGSKAGSTTSAAAAAATAATALVVPGSSGGSGSNGGGLFSPMTSQLPAVRAGSLGAHAAAAAAAGGSNGGGPVDLNGHVSTCCSRVLLQYSLWVAVDGRGGCQMTHAAMVAKTPIVVAMQKVLKQHAAARTVWNLNGLAVV